MDSILEKIERLAEMAGQQNDPVPLDVSGVMARIRGLEIVEEAEALPIRFFAGGAAAAAAAAIAVSALAAMAWTDIFNPVVEMDSLMDVMDIML